MAGLRFELDKNKIPTNFFSSFVIVLLGAFFTQSPRLLELLLGRGKILAFFNLVSIITGMTCYGVGMWGLLTSLVRFMGRSGKKLPKGTISFLVLLLALALLFGGKIRWTFGCLGGLFFVIGGVVGYCGLVKNNFDNGLIHLLGGVRRGSLPGKSKDVRKTAIFNLVFSWLLGTLLLVLGLLPYS